MQVGEQCAGRRCAKVPRGSGAGGAARRRTGVGRLPGTKDRGVKPGFLRVRPTRRGLRKPARHSRSASGRSDRPLPLVPGAGPSPPTSLPSPRCSAPELPRAPVLILALPAGPTPPPAPAPPPRVPEPRRSERPARLAGWEERLEVSGAGGEPHSFPWRGRPGGSPRPRPLPRRRPRADLRKLGARPGRTAAAAEAKDGPAGSHSLARAPEAASGRPWGGVRGLPWALRASRVARSAAVEEGARRPAPGSGKVRAGRRAGGAGASPPKPGVPALGCLWDPS